MLPTGRNVPQSVITISYAYRYERTNSTWTVREIVENLTTFLNTDANFTILVCCDGWSVGRDSTQVYKILMAF